MIVTTRFCQAVSPHRGSSNQGEQCRFGSCAFLVTLLAAPPARSKASARIDGLGQGCGACRRPQVGTRRFHSHGSEGYRALLDTQKYGFHDAVRRDCTIRQRRSRWKNVEYGVHRRRCSIDEVDPGSGSVPKTKSSGLNHLVMRDWVSPSAR
jgi:hypothetical protein